MSERWNVRPATADDAERLFDIHRAAMREYVEATWGEWRDEWQRERFRANYPSVGWQAIEVGGQVAGMVSWEDTVEEVWLAVIELDPAFQGHGIGTEVVRSTAARAGSTGRPVTLRVLNANTRARALYERLGFRPFKEIGTHCYLRLDPS